MTFILSIKFDNFYKRYDTFSIGVCNGCQVMAKLGYVEENITLNENLSGTAGGIGNAIMIGTGAILASLTSYYLENQTSSSCLVFIMLLSGALSYTSLYIFVLRNK